MALSKNFASIGRLGNKFLPIVQSERTYANALQPDDWKPGPCPQTYEERVAAAKKYNMILEDYEPYPEDGSGWGDYPKIDIISAEARDPFESYDDPSNARHYGEVMHIHADIYGFDRLNVQKKDSIGLKKKFFIFLAIWLLPCAYFWMERKRLDRERPILPKPKPYTGVQHYDFKKL